MFDTSKMQQRRKIRFESIDDVLAEVDKIVAAEKAGKLRRTGNWTAGQTFNHLASWINYAYDGFPMRTPWFIRMLLRALKLKKYLSTEMDAGIKIPGSPAGTYATEPLGLEEGAVKYRAALARLRSSEPARFDSPAFGKLSDADRLRLNFRHAELHLSFLHP